MVASRVSLAGDDHGRTAAAVVNAYLHPNLVPRAVPGRGPGPAPRPDPAAVDRGHATGRPAGWPRPARSTPTTRVRAPACSARATWRARSARRTCARSTSAAPPPMSRSWPAAACRSARSPRSGEVRHPAPVGARCTRSGSGAGRSSRWTPTGRSGSGPRSAGASPGPACFGLGGEWLTPTDVWLLLGYLEPGEFLGGRRRLSVEPARAVAEGIAAAAARASSRRCSTPRRRSAASSSEHLLAWAARHPELASSPSRRAGCSPTAAGVGCCARRRRTSSTSRACVVFPTQLGVLGLRRRSPADRPLLPGRRARRIGRRRRLPAAVARLADNARRDLRAGGRARSRRRPRVAGARIGATRRPDAGRRPERAGGAGSARRRRRGRRPRRPATCSVPRDAVVDMIAARDDLEPGRPRAVLTAEGSLTVPVLAGLGDPARSGACGPVVPARARHHDLRARRLDGELHAAGLRGSASGSRDMRPRITEYLEIDLDTEQWLCANCGSDPGQRPGQLQARLSGVGARPARGAPPGRRRCVHVRARPRVVPHPRVHLPRVRDADRGRVPAAGSPGHARHRARHRRAQAGARGRWAEDEP